MVAATTLTFTLMSLSEPTLEILFSCNALNTFACADKLISPISSKKIVPPFAASNLPALSLLAPVNEPFTCPNNSLSINSDGIAAQLTSIIGALERSDFSCNQCATNSLPVPFGPVIKTLASVAATFSIISLIWVMASLSPIIS